jgi:hypothetical protein
MVLYNWLKFDAKNCCDNPAVTCDVHERVTALFVIFLIIVEIYLD